MAVLKYSLGSTENMTERLYKKRKPQKSFCFFFCYFKTKTYICNVYHLKQARDGSPINIAAGIFYAHSFGYIPIRFRPPCGVLMHPQPVSGGRQRESGTFSVSFPVILITYCFILIVYQNEKSNCPACKPGKTKPYIVMA